MYVNPFPEVSSLNVYPFEVVSRYREPQLQMGKHITRFYFIGEQTFGNIDVWTHISFSIRWNDKNKIKLNESGFRPLLCIYRLNWATRTSWGWWDEWDDTVLQTQDSRFEPWRSGAKHATSRSRSHPTILSCPSGWGRNIFVSFKPQRPGNEPRTIAW